MRRHARLGRPISASLPEVLSNVLSLRQQITLCGSLSLHPVRLGAAIHTAGYAAVGLNWIYMPFSMDSARLGAALAGMRALGIRGFGVSMPFKIEVLSHCDRIDPLAMQIGAVNTVVNDDGVLTGHNTDASGAVAAIEEVSLIDGKECLVLGSGGAARAVGHALVARGGRVLIAGRTEHRASELSLRLGGNSVPWRDAVGGAVAADIVVNATSVGMNSASDSAPVIDVSRLRSDCIVMDIVYKPVVTSLVAAARGRRLRVVDGSRMLVHQAAKQFELYTGLTAPLAAMDAAVNAELCR